MNKNWLYRVLAMALIALLALPAFAMAEEVQTNAVEVAADEEELVIGSNDVADPVANVEHGYAFDEDYLYDPDGEIVDSIDMAISDKTFTATLITEYDIKSTKFSVKPASAASVSKLSDDEVKVKLKKACDNVTLIAKAKISADDEHFSSSRVKIAEVNFEVTDKLRIDKIKGNYSDDMFDPDDVVASETKTSYKVDIGEGKVLVPFAANKKGESLDYMVEADVDENRINPEGWGIYKYKWSNRKVALYAGDDNGNFEDNHNLIDLNDLDESDMSDYKVVFKKKGTSKVTFTSQYDTKKKATITYKVSIPDKYSYKAQNKDKPKADKEDNKIELVVKSAKYTDADTLEVVVWVANGSGYELKKSVDGVGVMNHKGDIAADGTLKFDGTIKKMKTGTAKIKFKRGDGQFDEMVDIKKGIYVDPDSVAILAAMYAVDEVECNKIEE